MSDQGPIEATTRFRVALSDIASLGSQAAFLGNWEESLVEAVEIAQEALQNDHEPA